METIAYQDGCLNQYLKIKDSSSKNDTRTVQKIIEDIKSFGDTSLKEYTQKFDNILLDSFIVSAEERQRALEETDDDFINLLKKAIQNIRLFHEKQRPDAFEYKTQKNSIIGQKVTPIERVALYIPGGKAAYPSSVLMNVIPAQIAGVEEIVLISPPNNKGLVDPGVLAAADLLGIEEIYKIGGAQAIAALAYGTDSIKKVDKIVGPGNQYVTEAKRQVFGQVAIDMIAGPSEILIIADENANPKYIARDLLSQSEHDEKAIPYLVTNSNEIINQTKEYLKKYINASKRKEILKKSIDNNLLIVKTKSLEEMIKVSNILAPEHLELLIDEPMSILDAIKNAGSIFLGEYSPEPVGDYWAGPNHTLPTSQTARFSSPLGVYDFVKRSSYIQYSKEDFNENARSIEKFAEKEQLWEHANSIKERRL
jgi:histidinol dehydrogenase